MGVFSWKTSDTKISVPNCMIGNPPTRPVKMLDNKGNEYVEEAYGGYGTFGGKDYYVLLAEMNGVEGTDEEKRSKGIDLWFGAAPCLAPKIVEAHCKIPYEHLPDSEGCDVQGHFYDDKEALFLTLYTEQLEPLYAKQSSVRPEEAVQ